MGMGTHTRYAFDFDWANILTMLWNYLMKSNIFCLGFPFLQLGRKKKHEKRCEIGKSVLRSHVLMVRISSSLCEKKKKWWYFFSISETSMPTRSCGYLQRHLLGCHPWRNCKWTLHKNVTNNRLELSIGFLHIAKLQNSVVGTFLNSATMISKV